MDCAVHGIAGSTGLWQDALTLRTSKIGGNVPLPACNALIAFNAYISSIISPPQPISLQHLRSAETVPVSLGDSAFTCWARDNREGGRRLFRFALFLEMKN